MIEGKGVFQLYPKFKLNLQTSSFLVKNSLELIDYKYPYGSREQVRISC